MPKQKNTPTKSSRTKVVLIIAALVLAGAGAIYATYRSMMVKPEINQIEYGRRGRDESNRSTLEDRKTNTNTNQTSGSVRRQRDDQQEQSTSRSKRRSRDD